MNYDEQTMFVCMNVYDAMLQEGASIYFMGKT